ncbi:sensor histidine kinase [Sporolituus thermophilus]|uniref:histidine kinase n=1 Tax=Sporolituus thermophilus DSM 23256 TaxID=1123285 RepID=A0A1G7N7E4_9FIRM|nr:histidine kinase N-terminal domain-containing protein [Sporolituus thermophilus]SDF69963.1 Two-component sensor histidine kinase, contains HisKA and HATPase domains [Sporolituus thermophilus DSM 23256]
MVSEICRKITVLNADQIAVLEQAGSVLGLASDLAYAQVTVYTWARDANYLVIVAQAKPNTCLIRYKPNLLGATVPAVEEPLVWRTLTSGESISGEREWALGADVLDMRTFPLRDDAGKIIAAVSFESSAEETAAGTTSALIETAYLLLTATPTPVASDGYRPLSARDGIIIADERGRIIFANAAAGSIYKVLGVGRLIGRRIYDRLVNLRVAQQAAATGQLRETELEISNMVIVQRAIPIIHGGEVVRIIVIVADVTELKKKEKELLIKSAVIQEIHHRVKNNLQTIASLLRLQARRTPSAAVKAALRESVNRILSISVVHEFLSQQDTEVIDIAEVTKNILDLVIQNMLEPDFNIQTVFNAQQVVLASEQATSLALVINELIQNALEHGFVGRREGLIGVDIAARDDSYQIEIYDNGIGLPPGFNVQTTGSLGLQIVRTLVETDLGGTFQLFSNNGTHARITIPRMREEGL